MDPRMFDDLFKLMAVGAVLLMLAGVGIGCILVKAGVL